MIAIRPIDNWRFWMLFFHYLRFSKVLPALRLPSLRLRTSASGNDLPLRASASPRETMFPGTVA